MRTKKQTILLTGGAGCIGAPVAARLISLGHTVVLVDNFNEYYDPKLKQNRIANLLKEGTYLLYKEDIADYKALKKIFAKHSFQCIIHLAAQAGVRYCLENPFVYEQSNVKGTMNLLELAKDFRVRQFLFASSSSVYGENESVPFHEKNSTDHPISLYAATKKAGEALAYSYHSLYKINCTCLRFFTVYGPWGRPDMAFFKFTKNILENKPIDVYGKGAMKRDFTYIDDIVEGVMRAFTKNLSWDIINLGYGKPILLTEFINIIEKAVGRTAQKNFLPMQKGDVSITYADTAHAQKILNWKPKTSLSQGIANFVAWYREYYHV